MAFAEQARAMKTLLAAEMWDSAEALGGFLCSASGGSDVAASADHARHLSLLGDALLGKREHRRAMNAFRQALSVNRLAPKVPTGNDNGSASMMGTMMGTPETPATPGLMPSTPGGMATPRSADGITSGNQGAPSGGTARPVDEAALKFKIGRCHLALREYRAALAELETIPARARTLPVTMTLAKTYRRTGYERAAVACYKEVVRGCPYAVDAIAALAELGCSGEEIRSLLPEQGPSGTSAISGANEAMSVDGGTSPGHAFEDTGDVDDAAWVHHLAEAHASARSHKGEVASTYFRRLDETFPNNPRIWCQLARVHADRGEVGEAADCYRRCRRADPCAVDGMDGFASLLYEHFPDAGKSQANVDREDGPLGGFGVLSHGFGFGSNGPSMELNALVNNLLETSRDRAESWSAAALYWESRGENDKALTYAER